MAQPGVGLARDARRGRRDGVLPEPEPRHAPERGHRALVVAGGGERAARAGQVEDAGHEGEPDVVEGDAQRRRAASGGRIDQPAERRAELGDDPELLRAGCHGHDAASTAGRPVRASNRRTKSASESAVKASRPMPVARMARSMSAGAPSTSSSGSMSG